MTSAAPPFAERSSKRCHRPLSCSRIVGALTPAAPSPKPPPQRFALLQQRISRNKLFTRPALSSAAPTDGHRYCELTPLQALLGTTGETHYVMGSLSQLEDGRFYLEDLTASIQVDLATAATTAGLFTENCIVVAEGALNHLGVFEVSALGFPPAESREETRAVTVGLDFFGGGCLRRARRPLTSSVVMFSLTPSPLPAACFTPEGALVHSLVLLTSSRRFPLAQSRRAREAGALAGQLCR